MLTFTVAQQGQKSGGTQLDRSIIVVQYQLLLHGNGGMPVVPVPGQGNILSVLACQYAMHQTPHSLAAQWQDPAMVRLEDFLSCLANLKSVDCKQPLLCMLQYQSLKMPPQQTQADNMQFGCAATTLSLGCTG